YAESLTTPRSGIAGAVTWIPAACRRPITPFQLDPSANAPWTRTTVGVSVLGVASDTRAPSLVGVDVDDSLRKSFGCFLWEVVADAALERPVLVAARELAGVGARVGVRGAVGVAFEGDRRHGDLRGGG